MIREYLDALVFGASSLKQASSHYLLVVLVISSLPVKSLPGIPQCCLLQTCAQRHCVLLVAGLMLLIVFQDVCYGVISLLDWINLVSSEVLWKTEVTPLEAQF